MSFLHPYKLLVDQTKHAVNLAIKENPDLLACYLSRSWAQRIPFFGITYCVNIILEFSMEISGWWWCPGARQGTSSGMLGRLDMTGVPKAHLTLSNLSRTIWWATLSGLSSKYSCIFCSRVKMIRGNRCRSMRSLSSVQRRYQTLLGERSSPAIHGKIRQSPFT